MPSPGSRPEGSGDTWVHLFPDQASESAAGVCVDIILRYDEAPKLGTDPANAAARRESHDRGVRACCASTVMSLKDKVIK